MYNTGSKFLCPDGRKKSSSNVFGEHSELMRFMLSRLVMAKELLAKNDVMAVSIDDYEHTYLTILYNA